MPNDTSNFPASYTPPLPKVFTSVDIISVTVLILRALRALQDANLVPQPDHLEPEMRKKQILSKYFVSLACQDNLSSWRNLLRPTSLPPISTPRPLSSLTGTIKRLFKMANVTPRTCSSDGEASKAQKASSDTPDVSDGVLVLGLGNLGERVFLKAAEEQAGLDLPATGPNVAQTVSALLNSTDDDSSSPDAGRGSASRGSSNTSPDHSADRKDGEDGESTGDDEEVTEGIAQLDIGHINGSLQLEEDDPQLPPPCEGCIADDERHDEIEEKLTAVQSEMHQKVRKTG